MSTILLIDSVHPLLSVSLIKGKNVSWKTHHEQRQHDKNIVRMVRELLSENNATFDDIDAYAVVIGPGSWTGCRVGISVVKGFCVAKPKPVIAVKSLDAIGERSALHSNLDNYFVKRGDIYNCEKLTTLEDFETIGSIGVDTYRTNLLRLIQHSESTTHDKLMPFYITEFQIKS